MNIEHLGRREVKAPRTRSPQDMRLHSRRNRTALRPLVDSIDWNPLAYDQGQIRRQIGTAGPTSYQIVYRGAVFHTGTLMDVSSILQDGRNINWRFLHFGDDLTHG